MTLREVLGSVEDETKQLPLLLPSGLIASTAGCKLFGEGGGDYWVASGDHLILLSRMQAYVGLQRRSRGEYCQRTEGCGGS